MSNRQKKKQINKEVNRLRNTPGWDPYNRPKTSPMEQLRQLDQESQNQRTYAVSDGCEACVATQEETGDVSALCEEHMAQALGF